MTGLHGILESLCVCTFVRSSAFVPACAYVSVYAYACAVLVSSKLWFFFSSSLVDFPFFVVLVVLVIDVVPPIRKILVIPTIMIAFILYSRHAHG